MKVVVARRLVHHIESDRAVGQLGQEVAAAILARKEGGAIVLLGCGSFFDIDTCQRGSLTGEHCLGDAPFAAVEVEVFDQVLFWLGANCLPVGTGCGARLGGGGGRCGGLSGGGRFLIQINPILRLGRQVFGYKSCKSFFIFSFRTLDEKISKFNQSPVDGLNFHFRYS